MPELPEVETLCRQLNTLLPGQQILAIEILDPRLGTAAGLAGRTIEAVSRQGKYIKIGAGATTPGCKPGREKRRRTEAGGPLNLLLHLRMTGRLFWQRDEAPLPPYTRMIFSFSGGRLLLIDPRRFATFSPGTAEAAPAPLANPLEEFPARRLREIAGDRRLPVKAFLMDQRFIAGIGNIYACEILHKAGIDPRRPAGSLKLAEWRKVEKSAGVVLPRAVACRGTSISDWRDLFGMSGTNQDHLEVYGREGEPCSHCGAPIERMKMSGRGTWFCPSCQE
ncbi:MAG: bifunctional DNA-formamidopyrimidine glycosylase/DNA-(apurinic or apyrimidinic site) lyase [Deltaproteobacteria bacterium]|nr:bifunctional DNA-formamidopyrimidine glycosylase/DNA-(apurinic or apyrimidinic site) lyase [Deltaproteobacteria bacterium]